MRKAPNTKSVIKTTETAAERADTLRQELARVQTDLAEIDTTIADAGVAVASVHDDLDTLTHKGWNVETYDQSAAVLDRDVAAAQAKRAENYVDEPTRAAKAAIEAAGELKKQVGALEARRTEADEAYGTQSDRLTIAATTIGAIREKSDTLHDTYNPACMVGFENLTDEIAQLMVALTSAHEAGTDLTGQQGWSVEAVKCSEQLNKTFDKTAASIQAKAEALQEREEHLAKLAEKLPRRVGKLTSRFERAIVLANDVDVEGETADEIRSLSDDVARLSASISTADGQKPNYLDVDKRHRSLAGELGKAHTAATEQKQEMDDLRTTIPQRIVGYNDLAAAVQKYASKVRITDETRNAIQNLKAYEFEMATDRKNMRGQDKHLRELVQYTNKLLKRAEREADEDHPLLAAAKTAGGIALVVAGVNVLD